MPYRPQGEFVGRGSKKRLSAHTLASFLYLQGATSVDLLGCEVAMDSQILERLIRNPAMEWWLNINGRERPGEPPWLRSSGSNTRLTEEGLSKIIRRVRGEEITADGRRSPYNVLISDVNAALQLIQNGPNSALGSGTELEWIALAPTIQT
jgi:hypothetical protein